VSAARAIEETIVRSRVLPLALVGAMAFAAGAAAANRSGAHPTPRPNPRPHVGRGFHWHQRSSPAGWRSPGASFPRQASDRREQSFQLPAEGARVVVDNIAGNVRVRAVDGDTVRLVAKQLAHARSAEDLELGRREMPLELSQHGGTVIAFVDSPFRGEDGDLRGPWDDLPYRVLYDFELEVPRRAEVELRTVLDGDVELAGTDGAFEVRNVNGSVDVRDVGGAGTATTVNGELTVRFRRNPGAPCDFGNVNGDVDVTFQPGLAAEVRFRTLNGEGWSDFPYSVVPVTPQIDEHRRDGRYVIKSEWSQGIRIGTGGPQLTFGTVNGDVLIRKST
jgi:hypothetical protein